MGGGWFSLQETGSEALSLSRAPPRTPEQNAHSDAAGRPVALERPCPTEEGSVAQRHH